MSVNVCARFPPNPKKKLRIPRAQIKKALVAQNFPSEAQERLLIRLRPFCKALLYPPIPNLNFSIDFHDPIPRLHADTIGADVGDTISQILADQFSDLQARLIAERKDREIQDCRDAGLL